MCNGLLCNALCSFAGKNQIKEKHFKYTPEFPSQPTWIIREVKAKEKGVKNTSF